MRSRTELDLKQSSDLGSSSEKKSGAVASTSIQIQAGRGQQWHRYVVAGVPVDSNVIIPALECFASTGAVPLVKALEPRATRFEFDSNVRGWTGGAWRDIEVGHHDGTTAIAVEGAGRFTVDDSGLIYIHDDHGAFTGERQQGCEVLNPFAQEVVLGPCLAVSLATRGIFLAHASAVKNKNNEVVLFAGNSGTGKSTIARELSQTTDSAWTRVADDIVALKIDGSELLCLPAFPQLKLDQPAMNKIASLPDALMVKGLFAASLDIRGGPMHTELNAADLVTQFVRHGVSLRVFDPAAVAAHFEFATQASQATSGYRLSWSHRAGALWALGNALNSL